MFTYYINIVIVYLLLSYLWLLKHTNSVYFFFMHGNICKYSLHQDICVCGDVIGRVTRTFSKKCIMVLELFFNIFLHPLRGMHEGFSRLGFDVTSWILFSIVGLGFIFKFPLSKFLAYTRKSLLLFPSYSVFLIFYFQYNL